ncbi:hypothetical protein GBAR_LOCUS8470, partial [Geodia barretti]
MYLCLRKCVHYLELKNQVLPSYLPRRRVFQKKQNGSVGSTCLGLLLRVLIDVVNVVLLYQAL